MPDLAVGLLAGCQVEYDAPREYYRVRSGRVVSRWVRAETLYPLSERQAQQILFDAIATAAD